MVYTVQYMKTWKKSPFPRFVTVTSEYFEIDIRCQSKKDMCKKPNKVSTSPNKNKK
jgi:hypothetical protein